MTTRLSFRSSDPHVAARWDCDADADAECVLYQDVAATGPARDEERADDPFAAFDRIARDGRRWAGYVGYELNRFIERLPPARRSATPTLPLLAFWPADDRVAEQPQRATPATAVVTRGTPRDAYLRAARTAIEYVAAGDVFQVNLAQTFDVATPLRPAEVWHRLRAATPATYGAIIDLCHAAIVSNSPELFFRIEPLGDGRRRITTRPIKGTRPRGPGMREELERSEKDKAELAMIVDLSRNDLGRVCEIGSVRVVEPRVIEELPTLYHGVATVEGMLRPDATLADVFRAMFPCGSITGCPKVRAMEIIDELEGQPRGPYCGAIGYVDADGSAEFSVAIRTMTMRDGVARVSVGGGIVADSDPHDEYRETIDKARAMLTALGVDDATIEALRNE